MNKPLLGALVLAFGLSAAVPPPPPGPWEIIAKREIMPPPPGPPPLLNVSIAITNFNDSPCVNPVFRTHFNDVVFVRGAEIISTNAGTSELVACVFCTNAVVLRWFGEFGKCYEVQWSGNSLNWTNSSAWRVGEEDEIEFLAPMELERCYYRLECRPTPPGLPE